MHKTHNQYTSLVQLQQLSVVKLRLLSVSVELLELHFYGTIFHGFECMSSCLLEAGVELKAVVWILQLNLALWGLVMANSLQSQLLDENDNSDIRYEKMRRLLRILRL